MSKYPNLGILDGLYELVYGARPFSLQEAKNKICKDKKDAALFHKRMYNFQKGGYIHRDNKGNFKFTQKGISVVNYAEINKLKIDELKKDGRWRIVIFDIPQNKSYIRHILRTKLAEFNFYKLQRSVYVSPYICEKEIKELTKLLGINSHLHIILAESLGPIEAKIKNIF
jgi:DNA-binding transcriptional regulator PaaX